MNISKMLTIIIGLLIAVLFAVEPLPAISSNHINSPKQKKYTDEKQDRNTGNLKPVSGLIESVPSVSMTERKANEETKNSGPDDIYRWPPTSGWAIVYITIAYVAISSLQLFAIRRQATIAEKALTTSERAWVGVGFDRSYHLGNDFIDLQIFNSGKSVGHIKDVQLFGLEAVEKGKSLPDKPKSVQPPGLGTWSIFPGESTIQRWDVRLDQEDISEVVAKTKLLPIYGFVRYADIFGDEHITKFYRVWLEDVGQLNGKFMIPPYAAPNQNEAT